MHNSNQLKTCIWCKNTKSRNHFYHRSGTKQGVQSICKECNKTNRTQTIRQNRQRAIDLLGGQCSRCGYNRYIGALHFHHPDPLLKDDLFHRIRNRSWEYIQSTLLVQKCILLCANCHAEEHSIR